ncbi:MAG: hypothetical protein BroJett010_25560 [Gammaproteobacteria bacterium]|nr:MAG: hypothetical protein BroJett010_25560 [Gammaproteobacteria bacterium]
MPMNARRWFLVVLALAIGGWLVSDAGQVVWRPWVSPRYAAYELASYDGKGVTTWVPNAAKFWGSRVYAPLAEATDQFDNLRPQPRQTLTEILLQDAAGNVAAVCEALTSSRNSGSRMVGFLAAKWHGIPVRAEDVLAREVRTVAARESTVNDSDTVLALRIVGRLGMPGMLTVVAHQAQRENAPSEIRKAACFSLDRLPEGVEAKRLLSRLRREKTCL